MLYIRVFDLIDGFAFLLKASESWNCTNVAPRKVFAPANETLAKSMATIKGARAVEKAVA